MQDGAIITNITYQLLKECNAINMKDGGKSKTEHGEKWYCMLANKKPLEAKTAK